MVSLIEKIANGIDKLISQGILNKEQDIILFGLDRYSFAMRTILSHRGYEVSAFLSDDENDVMKTRRIVKDFACRYFRSERDVIDIYYIDDDAEIIQDAVILLAVKDYMTKKSLLEKKGFTADRDFHLVYDFYNPEIDDVIKGKEEIDTNGIKSIAKDMLKILDDYCLKHDLRYWVSGGTMLGTVRHKGYIPWDDDIDIFLPYKDYIRLLNEFPQSDRYSFRWWGEYLGVFAKFTDNQTYLDHDVKVVRNLTGVWVDILPIIGLPDDMDEMRMFFREFQELEKSILQDFYAEDGNAGVFARRFLEEKSYLERYDFDQSKYVGVLGTAYGDRDYVRRTVYDNTIRMPFEDIEVNVPEGYEEYLTNLYGSNWMIPPEESKRTTAHDIKAYRVR